MLGNILESNSLATYSRRIKPTFTTKTVPPSKVAQALEDGWQILRKNKSSVQLKKEKSEDAVLTDRAWMLLYRLGFEKISQIEGAILTPKPKDPGVEPKNIGICALNDEVALVVKTATSIPKKSALQEFISETEKVRESLGKILPASFPAPQKRQLIFILLLEGPSLSAADREALSTARISLLERSDLEYYEKLCSHLGPAAMYQLLADLLPGKAIPALAVRVPAVKTKIGGVTCYSFAINPSYLLKISYISHRSKGKASDVNTYQRMVSKARLATIKSYISNNGVFPTNIVVNIEANRLRFEKIKQASSNPENIDSGVLGWLDIKPSYKSAWIIDGQHRLYAYSGHEKADNAHLAVLAFEGLTASKQAQLFIDINAKQKSVKQSLLQELYAELHWDATDPKVRIRAVVSKAIQIFDQQQSSPFFGRIQTADATRDYRRCISITSIFGALEKPGFFVSREKSGSVIEFGAFWAGDNNSTLQRTISILNEWFRPLAEKASDWWALGSAEGGGLAMNDGISSCIEVLRSVLVSLEQSGTPLVKISDNEVLEKLAPYSTALAEHLSSLDPASRKQFRDYRGVQGVTTRMRRAQNAMRMAIPTFNPSGLDEFLDAEKQQTNAKAKSAIDEIEISLQKIVLEILRQEYSDNWWVLGVPQSTRTAASDRFEKDDGKRGGREFYFDLIDYRKIASENWNLFEPILAYGKSGNKEKRTQWFVKVNDARKIVAHASSGKTLPVEELHELLEIFRWLQASLTGNISEAEDQSS